MSLGTQKVQKVQKIGSGKRLGNEVEKRTIFGRVFFDIFRAPGAPQADLGPSWKTKNPAQFGGRHERGVTRREVLSTRRG